MLITTYCLVFLLSVGVDEVVSKTLDKRKIDEYVQPFQKSDESKDSDEIVGGDVVDIKQYPYQVGVLYKGKLQCGGSIISEEFVLTAAHCIYRDNPIHLSLHVGSSLAINDGDLYDVAEAIAHPNYSREKHDYDIGILRSSSSITLNGVTTKAVRLADSTSSLKEGDNIIVTGWGRTKEKGDPSDVLRAVTVPVTSNEYCSKAYINKGIIISDRMLCAGLKTGGKDSCQGDSGGPAVEEESLVQYGIVSWGKGCARKGYPGVYAYIPPLREWVKEVTGV